MTTRTGLLALLATVLLSGCTLLPGGDDAADGDDPLRFDPSVSMTEAGAALAAGSALGSSAPMYAVTAEVAPGSGRVEGRVLAEVPAGADALTFRYFAGLPDLGTDAEVGEVLVDGEPAPARLDGSILTVPVDGDDAARVRVEIPFHYTLPPAEGGGSILDALGGMGGPADVGLLSRHDDALNLGHWFPVWVPEGNSAEPVPAGFGDIGNFPAAAIRLDLTVPEEWDVVDGGVRTGEDVSDGRRHVVTEGYGMSELVVSLLRDHVSRSAELSGPLEGVEVTAWGPRGARQELDGVLQETGEALETLSAELVAYPWREFDVVSAPLGAGVGGMEWPGATWIEPGLFAGGLPGLGGLEDSLGGLLGGSGGLDDLGGLLGGTAGLGGDTGLMLETMRAWTIAHEVGHEWWHVVVGNDSVLDPVVDEPLAQHSACLVMRRSRPADADTLCRVHVESAYEQMRMLGDEDAAAARATDDFASSGQYAGVVYGKAAAFYATLEETFGRERVTAALAAVTEQHAFAMLTAEGLRATLAAELDDPRFDRLWTRWMERARGDADLAVERGGLGGLSGLDGLGGLGGPGGPADAEELDKMIGELLESLEQRGPR